MLADNEMGRENELSGQVAAEPALLSFSNKAEPWRFQEGMPCWVCLGKRVRTAPALAQPPALFLKRLLFVCSLSY